MKFVIAILFLCTLLSASPVFAGTAEVRDVALSNNCPPKKIEIYKQSLGSGSGIVYRVQCVLPKLATPETGGDKPPDAILIGCNQSMCNMLRPVKIDAK